MRLFICLGIRVQAFFIECEREHMTIHKGSRRLSKGIKRTALSVALGICFVGGVQAQSAVGSIFGHVENNAQVTIDNLETGLSRKITADSSGAFSFPQLAPGRYRVTSGGTSREVLVKVGTGTQISLTAASNSATNLDAVTVVGSAAINPIDVSSVESTTVFTAEQIAALPVSNDITSVALLAPGTVKGDSGFGNLASFGGSSVAENGYYINGFDVTNMRNMLSFADLPFQAIAQQQVKTGGYGAEFGRSLGGVINLVTKRGSNEWRFGGSVEWEPDWARKHGKDVLTRDSESVALGDRYSVFRSKNEGSSLVYSAYASGPIIRDRLFFFAMVEGRDDTTDTFGEETSQHTSNTSPQGLVKLDWYITDDHMLEFTGIENTSKTKYTTYEYEHGEYNVGRHVNKTADYEMENGGEVGILKYTGYWTSNFTVSGQYGYLRNSIDNKNPRNVSGYECPWAYDWGTTTTTATDIGCFNPAQITINAVDGDPDEDERKAYRLDAEWQLGDHKIRFGYDHETYTSSHLGQTYTGGINWAYYTVGPTSVATGAYAGQPGRTVNGQLVPRGSRYARSRLLRTGTSTFENVNSAAYVEDSWQMTDNFMAYLGLRWEKFDSKNGDGVSWAESDYELAPRLGFSWDVVGDSTFKVFGNAGRYFIPIATNSSIRATGTESTLINFYYLNDPLGYDPATGLPVGLGTQIGPSALNGSDEAPNPASVASSNLSPMYQDEYILGAQVQLTDAWSAGARVIRREVKSGMDDTCVRQPFIDWAADQGLDDFDPSSVPSCYIINPGKDISINVDTDGDGDVELATVPASYFGLPKYQRTYTGLELFWERAGEKFQFQGSYTFSKSRGNIEGYVNSTLEQEDPGLTQDFDHALFMAGSQGPLPNDRTHVLKLFGVYRFTDEWMMSGNFIAQSGRPISCQGFIDLDDPSIGADRGTLAAYSGSTFYCLNDAGARELGHRGQVGRTPWTWNFDLGVMYVPNWANNKLKFKLDVFNLFNNDKVTEYDEFKESARDVISADYLNDVNYQTPRAARFTVRYDF